MDFLEGSDSDDESSGCEVLRPLADEASRTDALSLRPASSGVLAFHAGIEDAMLLYVERMAAPGESASVISAVDNFCYTRHWMMHVGDIKGEILDTALSTAIQRSAAVRSPCAVELGSYCGYSSVRIARSLPVGCILYSVEIEQKCRAWTNRLLRLAGLAEKVILVATVAEALEAIREANLQIFFLFIDHAKEKYVEDLISFEESGLMISPGCTVVADNILSFNAPLTEYISHVSDTSKYSHFELQKSIVEYSCASLETASETPTAGSSQSTKEACGTYGTLEDGMAISILQ